MVTSVLRIEGLTDRLSIRMQSMFMSHSLAKESRCFEWPSSDDVPSRDTSMPSDRSRDMFFRYPK
jgi:hypothetical protein